MQVVGSRSIQADRMRKLTLVHYFMATLAVGIVIGYPVWYWISEMFSRPANPLYLDEGQRLGPTYKQTIPSRSNPGARNHETPEEN